MAKFRALPRLKCANSHFDFMDTSPKAQYDKTQVSMIRNSSLREFAKHKRANSWQSIKLNLCLNL